MHGYCQYAFDHPLTLLFYPLIKKNCKVISQIKSQALDRNQQSQGTPYSCLNLYLPTLSMNLDRITAHAQPTATRSLCYICLRNANQINHFRHLSQCQSGMRLQWKSMVLSEALELWLLPNKHLYLPMFKVLKVHQDVV